MSEKKYRVDYRKRVTDQLQQRFGLKLTSDEVNDIIAEAFFDYDPDLLNSQADKIEGLEEAPSQKDMDGYWDDKNKRFWSFKELCRAASKSVSLTQEVERLRGVAFKVFRLMVGSIEVDCLDLADVLVKGGLVEERAATEDTRAEWEDIEDVELDSTYYYWTAQALSGDKEGSEVIHGHDMEGPTTEYYPPQTDKEGGGWFPGSKYRNHAETSIEEGGERYE